MKVIDDYIDAELAKDIYRQLVRKFHLKDYRSLCLYDSNKDLNDSFKIKKILSYLNFTKDFNSQLIINSFQENSRVLGPTEYTRHTNFFFMLCPLQVEGGGLYKLKEYWEPGNLTSDYSKICFQNNRLIVYNTNKQIFMEQINKTEGPVIYFSGIKNESD